MTILYHTRAPEAATATHLPAAARRFCAAAARRFCAAAALPCPDLTLARTDRGKPYFPAAPWLHASVSHSGEVWLAALSTAPVGVDIQRIRPVRAERLAKRFFHPDEAAWLAAHPGEFFTLWCAKEACVKLTGRGIAGEFDRFSVIADGAVGSPIDGTVLRYLDLADGYVLCLVGEAGEVTIEALD